MKNADYIDLGTKVRIIFQLKGQLYHQKDNASIQNSINFAT
jgi:hypothetical protein